jgi:orotidine-5'-phosphate decarboxylase
LDKIIMNNHPGFLDVQCGIIIAADVSTLDDLRQLAHLGAQCSEVVAIKVGFSLALRYGLPAVVKLIKETCNLPVIYDHQKAGTDIPDMGKPFAEVCSEAGVKGVIFFPHAGPRTLEKFVVAAVDSGLEPILGLVMTHPAYLCSEGGFIADEAPERICELGIRLGVTSFVLPGTKPDITSRFTQGLLKSVTPAKIMMPGIGSQGGSISIALDATRGHHAFPIIGSAIYKAADPKAALLQFASEMRV